MTYEKQKNEYVKNQQRHAAPIVSMAKPYPAIFQVKYQ